MRTHMHSRTVYITKTNTIIWNKEGIRFVGMHAAGEASKMQRWALSAWRCLGKKASRSGGRDATDEEVALHLGIVIGPHIPKVEVPQMEWRMGH